MGRGSAATLGVAAAWLGAALLFAAAVAPAAFSVLPTRALAGALVGRVLPVLFWTGLAAGALIALLSRDAPHRRWRMGGGAAMIVACALAQMVVGPRIDRLREAIGPSLEALAADDPRRAAFGRLHAASVGWLAAAMVGAAVAALAAALAPRARG